MGFQVVAEAGMTATLGFRAGDPSCWGPMAGNPARSLVGRPTGASGEGEAPVHLVAEEVDIEVGPNVVCIQHCRFILMHTKAKSSVSRSFMLCLYVAHGIGLTYDLSLTSA